MKLPGAVEYQGALQSPQLCFMDTELRNCTVEADFLGMPRPLSGGFALTYHLMGSGREWAVRCFHRDMPDLRVRYDAISRFLAQHRVPLFTPIEYQPQGIRVQGQAYPITKMDWIAGRTLCFYIDTHLHQPSLIRQLSGKIEQMAMTLEQLGVAHGDLQHGNIIVTASGALRLVDYDGFYVPALAGRGSANAGLANYQHPRRRGSDFGPTMDRFSLLVLYLGVAGTAAKPGLWARFSQGGNNVLLTQDDFLDPDSSVVLRELESVSGLGAMVRSFRSICKADIERVPSLAEFIANPTAVSPAVSALKVAAVPQFGVVDARDIRALLAHEGDVVEVVGYVEAIREDVTKYGKPYAFLNCGQFWNPNGCFTVVIWSEALANFRVAGNSPHQYERKWISVTGLVSVYRQSRYGPAPQVVPSWPGEIRTLTKSQAQARLRMGSAMAWSEHLGIQDNGNHVAPSRGQARGGVQASRRLTPADVIDKVNDLYGQGGPLSRPLAPPMLPSRNWMASPQSRRGGRRTPSPLPQTRPSFDLNALVREAWRKIRRFF